MNTNKLRGASLVEVTSFGYLHGQPPEAHLTIDLRHHFRDPHVSPELRHMTAEDAPVRAAVLSTPGVMRLLNTTANSIDAFAAGPSTPGIVSVAAGCAGGRHRAATFAIVLTEQLADAGYTVRLTHRDLSRPVVQR